MKAQITYTPATQEHSNVRMEYRVPGSGSAWSIWQTVATGAAFAKMTLNAGNVFEVRLISVNGTEESVPSAPIVISHADGEAALTPPAVTLDPPSNVGVVYSAS